MKTPHLLLSLVAVFLLAATARAQTTAFTFQGRLNDNGTAANGSYDMQLKLYDSAAPGTGTQVGATITLSGVPVTNGVFTVQPDFTANAFRGADRFVEVAVKPAGSANPFNILSPRQPITPTPYAIRSTSANMADSASAAADANHATNADNATNAGHATNADNASNATNANHATSADNATNAGHATIADNASNATNAANANNAATATNATQLGGQPASNYVQTNDGRLSDARPPTAGSANYIQNTTTQQAANFNIGGSATIGSGLMASSGRINGQLSLGGGASPQHQLSIAGGPSWTSTNWIGQVDLQDGGAIGWGPDSGGSSFGIAQGFGGLNFFHSASKPGDTAFPTHVDMVITDAGDAGIGANGSAPTAARVQINAYGEDIGDKDGLASYTTAVNRSGVYGVGHSYGVSAYSFDTGGTGLLGAGETGVFASGGRIALRARGTSWFQGNTTPLPQTAGVGVAIGSDSTSFGYLFAFDYLNFVPKVLALNGPGGSVGIGTTAPARTLDVNGRTRVESIPLEASVASVCFNQAGDLVQCGASSLRWKTNLQPFTGGLDIVRRLRPISFNWKENDLPDIGLAAEEVAEVAPSLIFKNSKGEPAGVKYERLDMALINAVQQQQKEIDGLKEQQKEIERLKAEVRRLRAISRARRK
jgi:hypothetical protein